MAAVWGIILAGLFLCRLVGRRSRALKALWEDQLSASVWPDRELELIEMSEEEFSREYHSVTGENWRILRNEDGEGWQRRRCHGIEEIARREGWHPIAAEEAAAEEKQEKKREPASGENQDPRLATASVFLYNRNSGGKVVPFPLDHRGGA